jgi:uncharacterized delta-60 repeat protein
MENRITSRAPAILFGALTACAFPDALRAADGDLDLSFGIGGKISTSFGVPAAGAKAVALQPDGKIVAAGWLFDETANVDFALARHNPDGSLDPSFGSGGRVRTDFSGRSDIANAVAIQPDGKILVAGSATTSKNTVVFALARYDSNGELDPTFDGDGRVTGDFFGYINSFILVADGKIVVGGGGIHKRPSVEFTLARYDVNGKPDSSFGSGGVVHTDFSNLTDFVVSVLLLPNGKLFAVGTSETNVTADDLAVARYNSDGTPDSAFGSGGKTTIDFAGHSDDASAAAVQPDGKIVIAAAILTTKIPDPMTVVRILPDGALDPDFGNQGRATAPFLGSESIAYAIALQSDGKIVAAGLAFGPDLYDFALARFNSDGSPDESFGPGGAGAVTDFFGMEDGCNAVIIQPDGRIIAAGSANAVTQGDMALARYIGSPTAPAQPACPHSAGFWKNHGERWPVSSLTLGSQFYPAAEIAALLKNPTRGDASLLLARELIAAKFNLAAEAGSPELAALVTSADVLLSGFTGKLPYGVSPGSSAGRSLVALSGNLASWNDRRSSPGCGDSDSK